MSGIDPERLRSIFRARGWSIHMEDNGQSVLDPFPVVADEYERLTDEWRDRLRTVNLSAAATPTRFES